MKIWISEYLPPFLANLRYMCRLAYKSKLITKFDVNQNNMYMKVQINGKKFQPWSREQLKTDLLRELPEKKKEINLLYTKCVSK